MPGRLILLRHGEKACPTALSSTGVTRSLALAQTYLGKNAGHSLFDGDEPAAFFALTPHTIETVSPSAASWGLPVRAYSLGMLSGSAKELAMNLRTREAAADLLRSKWDGKTVVVVWEHKRIASDELEKHYPEEKVTLRQLLGLASVGVPDKWEGENYNYFWIVSFGKNGAPSEFRCLKQDYRGKHPDLPDNDWGKPADPPAGADCQS